MYTAGYAAPEQYRNFDQMGPWSDIYAVGATLYCCISGAHPPAASDRVIDDKLIALKSSEYKQYSDDLLAMVDWCLKLDHLQRPQTAFELQKALMKDIPMSSFADDGAMEALGDPADPTDDAEPTFAERWRVRLNRKIF